MGVVDASAKAWSLGQPKTNDNLSLDIQPNGDETHVEDTRRFVSKPHLKAFVVFVGGVEPGSSRSGPSLVHIPVTQQPPASTRDLGFK